MMTSCKQNGNDDQKDDWINVFISSKSRCSNTEDADARQYGSVYSKIVDQTDRENKKIRDDEEEEQEMERERALIK